MLACSVLCVDLDLDDCCLHLLLAARLMTKLSWSRPGWWVMAMMSFTSGCPKVVVCMQHVNTLEEALLAVEQLLQNHLQSAQL